MARTPALIAVVIAALLCASCTSTATQSPSPAPATSPPTASSPSASPSATATQSWSAQQAAAIEAVDAYRAASQKIWSSPGSYSESEMKAALKASAGPDVVSSNVGSYLDLKKRELRILGDTTVLTSSAGKATDVGYATQVVVTLCIDQSQLRAVDSAGNEVGADKLGYELTDFNLREYTVQKRDSDKSLRVYGIAPAKGVCGP